MRSIRITGKHNIDKMEKIGNQSYKAVRKHMTDLDASVLTQPYQLDLLRNMYLSGASANAVDAEGMGANAVAIRSLFYSELNHKIQGQDIKKDIHLAETLINMEDVLEKLVGSQLTCCYCSKPIFILYKNVREPLQWTLDRLDNTLGHTKANTCISCLKCNLQRRLTDVEKFTFTKKLKIQKL